MLIKDLISQLKEYPQDMIVLVDGYEAGYDEVHLRGAKVSSNSVDYPLILGQYDDDQKGIAVLILSRF
jgi:hypothetical protein